jgi:hypothetical protein
VKLRTAVAAIALIVLAGLAQASRPVPYAVTGCVEAGQLTDGRYTYRVVKSTHSGLENVDLSRHEGRSIRVRGDLLPGDLLIVRSIKETSRRCP